MNDIIDSHAHLDNNRFSMDRADVIARMEEYRIIMAINPEANYNSNIWPRKKKNRPKRERKKKRKKEKSTYQDITMIYQVLHDQGMI